MTIAATFLDACRVADQFLNAEEIGTRWDHPSALAEMSVGALAGHLVRAVTSVVGYLDRPPPDQPAALDAPGYFLSIDLESDLDSDLHRAIRRRAAEQAEGGQAVLLEQWQSGLADLESRLDTAPPTQPLAALGGRVIRLDEYLVTRLVEVVAHTDDLAASLGVDPPRFTGEATSLVIECLTTMARTTHGDMAVVRALIRRERDLVEALRVF